MGPLQIDQFAVEGIILPIADLRLGLLVVEAVMMGDLPAEVGDPVSGRPDVRALVGRKGSMEGEKIVGAHRDWSFLYPSAADMAIFEQHSSEIENSTLWKSFQGVGTGGALPKTGLWLQPGRSNFRGLGGELGTAAGLLFFT